MKQSKIVKEEIMQQIDNGLTDKHEIFSKVVEKLQVPRPTVRRCARELKRELLEKIKVLNGEIQHE